MVNVTKMDIINFHSNVIALKDLMYEDIDIVKISIKLSNIYTSIDKAIKMYRILKQKKSHMFEYHKKYMDESKDVMRRLRDYHFQPSFWPGFHRELIITLSNWDESLAKLESI
jgi:hypothetical protein